MAESDTQSQWVKDQLTSWGLEELHPIFEAEGIDKETLLTMPLDVVKELIPKVGPRCIFVRNRTELIRKTDDGSIASSVESNIDDLCVPITSKADSSNIAPASAPEKSSVAPLEASTGTQKSGETTCVPHKIQLPIPSQAWLQRLKELLAETVTGRALLQTSHLQDSDRNKLCGIIIENALKTDWKIKTETLVFWANEIHGYWRGESKEAYFVPYQSAEKRSATGKRWNKYTNTEKYLKRHILPARQQLQPNAVNDDDNRNLLQLKTISPDGLESARTLWERTHGLRDKTESIDTYYQEYPILSTPIGSSLLQLDFELSNVCTDAEGLLKKWPHIAAAVVEIAKKKKLQSLDQEVNIPVEVLGLLKLPYLFRPSLVKTRTSKKWKPSTREQADGFICNIAVMSDLETLLVNREEKLLTYGLTCQPFVVAVGAPTAFSAIYIIVNEVKYTASNLIGAVDLCFKIHYALNAKYSAESEIVWSFLQKFVHGIEGSKHSVNAEVLWSDILMYQESNELDDPEK